MAVTEVLQSMSELEGELEPVFAGLQETPLGQSGLHAFHAVKFFIMSEKKHQKAERMQALGLDPKLASQHAKDSDRFNELGRGRLRAATRALERGKTAMKKPQMEQIEEEARSTEFRDELNAARDAVQGHLVKVDLLADQAGETYKIWQETFDTLQNEGPAGLTKFYEKNLQEMDNQRAAALQ